MSVQYCTGSKPIEIASYDEVKKISLEDKPEILLIDVREPDELKATGQIRNSINIPCKYFILMCVTYGAL